MYRRVDMRRVINYELQVGGKSFWWLITGAVLKSACTLGRSRPSQAYKSGAQPMSAVN